MGRKKSEFFKNGVKPLLWTLLGTHNSNLLFGPIFGPILGQLWAQKTKKRPEITLQIHCFFPAVWALLLQDK